VDLVETLNESTDNQTPLEMETETIPAISSRPLHIPASVVDVLSNYAVPGLLVGFTPGEVAILVDEQMPEQRAVDVQLSSFSFTGQTLYCRPSEGQYEAHISIDDVDRTGLRRAPRFPVTIPAELMTPHGEPIAGTIRDISRDGMGLESPLALEAGQPIGIVSGPAFVFAVVRHCNPIQGGRFRVGVEMHHLFERPEPQVNSVHPASLRDLWGKWFTKTDVGVRTSGVGTAK